MGIKSIIGQEKYEKAIVNIEVIREAYMKYLLIEILLEDTFSKEMSKAISDTDVLDKVREKKHNIVAAKEMAIGLYNELSAQMINYEKVNRLSRHPRSIHTKNFQPIETARHYETAKNMFDLTTQSYGALLIEEKQRDLRHNTSIRKGKPDAIIRINKRELDAVRESLAERMAILEAVTKELKRYDNVHTDKQGEC